MYLKTLYIHGFKSFPSSVTLEFNKGITSVVGPNGSGKSNVSDAVRWVLGEQSAKNLRGSKMEDVIFFGTANRKSVGYAEVTMVLDNTDRKITLDFNEIKITRRQTRSGESTYQINGVNSRLKDIQELFMDTGIGKEGYSIIGQGRIEEILKAKSDERRLLFEEATGIVKYKKRRSEALSKLAKQMENLLRVNDILKELEIQVGPLKVQSEKAKKYLTLYDTKKTHQIALFISDVSEKEVIEKKYINEITELKENIAQKQNQYETVEQTISNTKETIHSLTEQLKSLREDFSNGKEFSISLSHSININEEKINSIEENIARLENELLLKNNDIETKQNEIQDENIEITDIEERLLELYDSLDKKEKDLASLQKSLGDNDEIIKDFNQKILSNAENIAKLENKITNEEELYENLNDDTDDIISNIKSIKSDIISLKESVAVHENDVKNTDSDIEKLKNDIKEFEQSVKDLKEQQLELSNKKNKISINYHEQNAKYKSLLNAQKAHTGYYDSVKFILTKVDSSDTRFKGVLGTVGDIFTTKKDYEIALATTLSSSIQNIVTDNEITAKNIINILRQENKGRCTFLPLTTVKTFSDVDNNFLKENGVIGFFKDLVQYDKIFEPIAKSLLQRTLVIDTLDNAILFNKKYKNKIKIVTLSGDILSTTGSMSGGSSAKNTINIFANKRILSDTETLVADLKQKLDNIIKEENILEEKSDYYRDELSYSRTTFSEKQQFLGECKNLFETSKLKLSYKQDELLKTENKDKLLLEQITAKNLEIKELYKSLQSQTSKKEALQLELDNFAKNADKSKDVKESNQAELMKINVEISKQKELKNTHNQNLFRIENILKTLNDEIASIQQNINSDKESKASLNDIIDDTLKKRDDVNSNNDDFTKTINSKEMALNESIKNQESLEASNKNLFIEINELTKVLDKDELYLQNVSNEISKLYDDIWNEYELTYQMCLEYPKVDLPYNDIKKIFLDTNKELRQLGSVNMMAIDQYKEVSERYEFLLNQKEDIVTAEKKLDIIIKELTSLMETQFNEQFEIIRQNFKDVFQSMFGGGSADLMLTDDGDPLSSPIEILAEPPGKKLKSLMLMSGGEKSLTAICLLFGILQMKPSPFCILDEIEAALDDANVDRYAKFLADFKEDTQFILITHRKGTMVIADTLYGVTMEEQGVSKLISVKLEDYEEN